MSAHRFQFVAWTHECGLSSSFLANPGLKRSSFAFMPSLPVLADLSAPSLTNRLLCAQTRSALTTTRSASRRCPSANKTLVALPESSYVTRLTGVEKWNFAPCDCAMLTSDWGT